MSHYILVNENNLFSNSLYLIHIVYKIFYDQSHLYIVSEINIWSSRSEDTMSLIQDKKN